MKKSLSLVFCSVLLSLAAISYVHAGEKATKEECVSKVQDVIAIASQKSPEEAIKQVNDKNGPFVWKDTYVYIMDLNATILAHGPQPKFIGKNLMGLKDPVTKQPWYPALFEKIKAMPNSKGWFDYHWRKPGAEGVYKKICYYQRAGDIVVFAGIYGEQVK